MLNHSTTPLQNETIFTKSFDFHSNPNLVNITISCAITCVWLILITFYNSQLLGFIVTKILSKCYITDGYIHIGSFSVSLLAGKVMFKDVQYITKDYSIQIVDGLAIFKWWLMYNAADLDYYRKLKKDKDLTEAHNCRLVLYMNGLEFHLYNRSDIYQNIADQLKCERYGDAATSALSSDNLNVEEQNTDAPESAQISLWRDLFPLVQMKIRSGKLAVGNRLLETTLWVHFNSGDAAYSMPDASSSMDYFTHFLQCKCSDVQMLLSHSPGYKGQRSEPPSFMGDGFVVLQSVQSNIIYYQDEPGVPQDVNDVSSDPEWGLEVAFHKSATIRYGPWVDRQRFNIQKYFFPNNFKELVVTKPVEPDERRVHSGFDVNVEFAKGTTFDMLFSKDEETSAIHICCGDVATFHYYQPWIVNEYGYSNNIVAKFQKIEVSTSMSFQKLIECEVIEVVLNMTIPRMWNCFQRLTCEIWLTKTTCYYINDQLDFINDLMADWSATDPPDIAKFLPYEWEFHLYVRDFELILLANEFNWVDCTNENENHELALCGETLDISFVLSFTQFLPEVVQSKFFFRGETVILRDFLPQSNTLRRSVISLSRSSDRQMYPKFKQFKGMDIDADIDVVDGVDGNDNGSTKDQDEVDCGVSPNEQLSEGWRRRTGETNAWVDVWSVPVIILNLYYKYHPQHFENEETRKINTRCDLDYTLLEPTKLESDVITVELEAGPSALRIFGSFWRQFFMGIKNNYFGSCQDMHEFNAVKAKKDVTRTTVYSNSSTNKLKSEKENGVASEKAILKDMRHHRPFEANVTVVLLEIQAELSMHTNNDVASPQVFSDRVTFELHKTFKETRLQLIVSPVSIIVQDGLKRAADHSHLSRGFLTLSGLQFRGHAMFSDKDIPIGTETVEYAWLTELQCGKLTGKITPLQVQLLLIWAETFLLHLKDEENVTTNPDPVVRCPHNENQLTCSHIVKGHKLCPSEDELKYKMFRFSIEAVDIYISEAECACNVQASPIRFSLCNSTSHETIEGGSFFINEITIRQFLQQLNYGLDEAFEHSNSWVEVGVIGLGPVTADIRELGKEKLQLYNQVKFLKLHDKETKRLWFLWSADKLKSKLAVDRCRRKICACVGGSNFFDTNNNGVRFFTTQALDASGEKYTHYGSESLWGGQTDVGNSVKMMMRRKSDGASTSMSNLGSSARICKQKRTTSGKMLDTTDTFGRSSSFLQTGSKIACDRSRSRSLAGQSGSQVSFHKRTDSDDATFYSCNSEADIPVRLKKKSGSSSKASMKSGISSVSYVSAVSSADLLDGNDEEDMVYPISGPLVAPGLLMAYTHYMQPITCINWRQKIPTNYRRKFSILKNLKFNCPNGYHSSLPNTPLFNPSMQGKLPFVIVSNKEDTQHRRNKLSNQNSSSSHTEVNEKKSFVTVKLHRKVSLVLTPLLVQALDRYILCLSSVETNYHVLHALDSLHAGCISKSKKQYTENSLIESLTTCADDGEELVRKLKDTVPPDVSTLGVQLPEINLIFFQISSEMYTPSEQSSLSGQCGSEYSDCDVKNTNCVLLAARFSHLTSNIHHCTQNENLFNSTVTVAQKYNSIDTPPNYLSKCKGIITLPSVTAFSGSLNCLHTQVLYLEGNNDRQVNVTCIPTVKSNISFHVLRGGELNFDPASGVDSGKQEHLGNIIFEVGIEGINIHGVFQKKINCDLIKENNNKSSNNNNNDSCDDKEHNDSNCYVKVTDKPEYAIVEVIVEDETPLSVKADEEPTSKSDNVFDSDSSIGSFNSNTQHSSTRKGYISLDVDSGDIADTSDVDGDDENEDDEDGHVSISTSSPKNAVRFSKKTTEKKSPAKVREVKLEPVVLKDLEGDLKLKVVWINLAAPTHLRNIYHEDIQNLNLVTVFVPALSCWIEPIVDLFSSLHTCTLNHTTWMRTVLACFMGQGLPESFVKKHNISCAVTNLSQFLQEEYSSKLIYVMRKESEGSRLEKIRESLRKGVFTPKTDDLLTGIHALARQWKCVFVGAEVPETAFGTSQKKHVVGRGRLTEKDLNFLMKSSEVQSEVTDSPSMVSPVEVLVSSELSHTSDNENESCNDYSDNHALLSPSLSEEDGSTRKSKLELEMEQSLYDWMSKSPPSAHVNCVLKDADANVNQPDAFSDDCDNKDKVEQNEDLSSEKLDKIRQLDILRSTSPMVSVPTSGMQLAKAALVFNSVFSVVGIKAGPRTPSQTLSLGVFCLDNFQINLLDSEVNDEEDVGDTEPTVPAFLLEKLKITVQGKGGREQSIEYISSMVSEDLITNDVKFVVNVLQVHQHLDFRFVRLVLQITETMRVLKEQKKFAQKNKEMPSTNNGYDWDKVNIDLNGDLKDMPKSWMNMYKVMKLYRMIPDEDFSMRDVASPSSPSSMMRRHSIFAKPVINPSRCMSKAHAKSTSRELYVNSPKKGVMHDVIPMLALNGVACLKKAKLTASIIGLDLDFEMKQMNMTYIKSRNNSMAHEKHGTGFNEMSSLSIHMNKLTFCILESIRKAKETMLTCKVSKSHALHTTMSNPSNKLSKRSLLAIGPIAVQIPQHPGALRNIITQFTARLQTHYMEFDAYQLSRSTPAEKIIEDACVDVCSVKESNLSITTNSMFRVTSDAIKVSAALLPSLNVEYKIDKVTGWGSVNGKVKFFAHLPSHVLSFDTKVQVVPLPPTTHISLPPIKVEGHCLEIHTDRSSITPNASGRSHSYLSVQVNIGPLIHNLSTNLLNHLIFLQKGFAKEVNEVVQDVGINEPIPFWKRKSDEELVSSQPMIYSIKLKIQSISITATTPSSTGVRLVTGEVLFELSNQSPASSVLSSPNYPSSKMYGKAKVDLTLSLGQFNKVHYLANEQDLSVFANFHTSLGMRNSAHENSVDTENKETIFITLEKPQFFVMPAAVDKGVSVYLHYKNAYNQWVEQRSALSSEYSTVAERILNRFPQHTSRESITSYLFLQVNINDMGIGLPLKETTVLPTTTLAHGIADVEPGTALLITIAGTSITCCNSGSFVSTGLFKTFCIRFAENFDHTSENWCWDANNNANTYVIPEGSYEVCSRTINDERENASGPGKWVMTFFWKMRGVDANFDANIGKRLSLLTNVLTAITGDSDVADLSSVAEAEDVMATAENFQLDDDGDDIDFRDQFIDPDGLDIPDNPTNYLQFSDSLQRQFSVHTRRVDELRRSNASPDVINKEVKRLQEIESVLSNQFFKDVKKKFRRKSTRIKGRESMKKRSVDLKHQSLYIASERMDTNMEYLNNDHIQLASYDDYDTVDAPNIPEAVMYNLPRTIRDNNLARISGDYFFEKSGISRRDIYGKDTEDSLKRTALPVQTNASSEDIRSNSHVKFTDSTFDVRSEEGSGNVSQPQHLSSTALDFELNVVVDIDSGKLTFHTGDNSEAKEEELSQFISNRDIDRRHSDQFELKDKKIQNTYNRPVVRSAVSVSSENAVILIPGVTARVHYLSTNILDLSAKNLNDSFDCENADNFSLRSGSNVGRQQLKSADVNALILIQSISREMVIRPSLLDFLEKAIEPIIESVQEDASEAKSTEGTESILSSSGSSLYSFPVNASVLIRIDPSDIRLSCIPVSKVECLLRIPCLDFAITKTNAPHIIPLIPSPKKKSSTSTLTTNPSSSTSSESDISSGFSFTLCLSRFSFCIFHPYGTQYGSTTDSRLSAKSMFVDQKREMKKHSQPISGRKDSLSLNVEFIKFNYFRKTTKIPIEQISSSCNSQEFRTEVGVSALCDIGSASFNYDMRRLNEILDVPKAWYRRVLVQRIFLGREGYNATQNSTPMQPCTRATSFEKRRSQDVILQSDRAVSDLQLHQTLKPSFTPHKKAQGLSSHRRAISGGTSFFSSLMSPFPIPRTSTAGSRKDVMFPSTSTSEFSFPSSPTHAHPAPEEQESHISHGSSCNEWETNVVVAFKVSRIDVSTNMGNVMGQATWSINDLNATCNVLLNNSGKRTGNFDMSIRQSSLGAHGGVIGVYAELHDIKTDFTLDENLGKIPQHAGVISMKNVELRLDYMGSSIIMAMLSLLKLKLMDEWQIPDLLKSDDDSTPRTESLNGSGKKSEVMIICDVSWDELQLIMSRSTTPDIVKIIAKLEDFFDQQHRNSIRALSTIRKLNKSPNYMSDSLNTSPLKQKSMNAEKKTDNDNNGLKYQHWMEILNGVYGIKFRNIVMAMPDKNVTLGGKLCLHGNFVSLTCFHGVNFRSQNWGLFTLIGPCLQFETENQAFEKSCKVMRGTSKQNFTLSLGDSMHQSISERRKSVSNMHDFMATVRRVSRGSRNPPSLGAHVQDWMMFVNTISENDMPSGSNPTNKQTNSEKFSHTKVTSSIRKVSFAPKFRYENESEVIFALPRLYMELTTEHDLPMTSIISSILSKTKQEASNFSLKPSNHTVDIKFKSDFDDSLTVNVSLLLYLHDLVLNYMKEKDASVTSGSRSQRHSKTSDAQASTSPPKEEPPKNSEPIKKTTEMMKRTDSTKEKYREFRTLQWNLEPKVSVLTWGGSRMEPINIEWVLEKLGFLHASLTIPKWMQRGALDPMDVVLAWLAGHMLAHMVEKDSDS